MPFLWHDTRFSSLGVPVYEENNRLFRQSVDGFVKEKSKLQPAARPACSKRRVPTRGPMIENNVQPTQRVKNKMALTDTDYAGFLAEARAPGEELFQEGASSLLEGITEDSIPRGTQLETFLAAFFYAVGKKAVNFPLFSALGTDPATIAKYATRGAFAGISGVGSNSKVPRGLFFLIRKMGPLTGGLQGILDGLRRRVIDRLNEIQANPDLAAREASLQPSLGVAEGLVEFRWDKFTSGKAPTTAAVGGKAKADSGGTIAPLPGTGKARYIRDVLVALDEAAAPGSAKDRVALQMRNLNLLKANDPEAAADVFELSARGLLPNDDVLNILALPDGYPVRSEKKDPATGKWIMVEVREARLKALARECLKRVDEARLADGTDKPKEDKAKAEPVRASREVGGDRRLALAEHLRQNPYQAPPIPFIGNRCVQLVAGALTALLIVAMVLRVFVGPHPNHPSAHARSGNRAYVDGGVTRQNTNTTNSNNNNAAPTGADAGR